jgi:DNA (cytosine-5)-methyltransferase 1
MIIKVGTDCSGIEAPIEALKCLCDKYENIKYKHIFSSEKDKFAIRCIKENNNPDILYEDIQQRDINIVPNINLYCAGFPCQPYSRANKYKSNKDPRLNLFKDVLKVIMNKIPECFILENVKTLVTLNDGHYFNEMLSNLKKNNLYNIHYKVLNSKDYGIPQSRDRLYIIGILKTKQKKDFTFPSKCKMHDILSYVDINNNNKDEIKESNIELFKNIPHDSVFIDVGFRKAKYPNSNKWAPCITAQPNMWCVSKNRKASIKEYLKLQGFPETYKKPDNVSEHQLKIKIGNSMTVNVIEKLLENIFLSLKWI